MKKLTLLLLFVLSFGFTQAQYIDFTEVTPHETLYPHQDFEDGYYYHYKNIDFGDIDNDGDIDIVESRLINGGYELYVGLNDGVGNFTAISSLPSISRLYSVFLTDANSDGFLDIFLGYRGSGTIYFNDGLGNFSGGITNTYTSDLHTDFIFGDLDSDGDDDFIVGYSIFMNDGTGTYIQSSTRSLYVLEFLDYNNDGYLDILSKNGSFYIEINDGHGNFMAHELLNVGTEDAIKILDLDNDGDKDIVGFENVHTYNVYENIGAYSFQLSQTLNIIIQDSPYFAFSYFLDFDGDGYKDLFSTNKNTIFLNDQTGHFSISDTLILPEMDLMHLRHVDLDNDGDKDIVCTSPNDEKIIALINNNGRYIKTGDLNININSGGDMDLADIDNDGISDLLVVNSDGIATLAKIYKGTSAGFEVQPLVVFDRVFGGAKYADVNNDGFIDVIIIGFSNSLGKVSKVYINDGYGNFTSHILNNDFLNITRTSYKLGDLNNDGFVDVIGIMNDDSNNSIYSIIVYYNDQSGNFPVGTTVFEQQDRAPYVAVADLDNNGFDDIIIDGIIKYFDAAGVSRTETFTNVTDSIKGIFVLDKDADGDKDILFAHNYSYYQSNLYNIYENDGNGNFSAPEFVPSITGLDYRSLKISDIDNDNFDDLISFGSIRLNLGGNFFGNIENPIQIGSKICISDINNDTLKDILTSSGSDKHLILNMNQGTSGFVEINDSPYVITRTDDYPTYNLTDILSERYNLPLLTFQGFYDNMNSAQAQVNALPNIYVNREQHAKNIVGRFEKNGTIIYISFDLAISPAVYLYHPTIPDVNNDGTETINLREWFSDIGYSAYYIFDTEANAFQDNRNMNSSNITFTNTEQTFWLRGELNGQTVTSPIHFSLAYDFNTYTVDRIPYSLYQINATPATVRDDQYSNLIPIDFDFDYFGNNYQNILIGSNGIISLNEGLENAYCNYNFYDQYSDEILQKNAIYGIFQDLDNSNGNGSIGYSKIGTAPFRKFVTFYDSIPLFLNQNITATSQVVLYETYNFIDVQVKHREPNITWLNGNAVIGIRNIFGNKSYYPPNRYIGNWTADNEAWRFRPEQTFPHYQYILCDANNDGVETFSTSYILNHFNIGGTGVTYSLHFFEDEANANSNPITGNFQNTSNAQTVFVRIDDNGTVTIKRVLLAAIDCTADYDIDGVATTAEDINGNGNYGDDDTDGDGIPDFMDDDDDGDMILTNIEIITSRSNTNINYSDTDGDSIPNYLDNDDDGDGVLTINEDYDGDGNPLNDDVNNDGIPDYLQQSVTNGVVQLGNKELMLYPNPTKNDVNLKFAKNMHNITVTVLSFDGRELSHNYYTQANQLIITLPNEKGIYFVKVSSNEGAAFRKIIKE